MEKQIKINISGGYGDNEQGTEGTAKIINMMRDTGGTWRSRSTYVLQNAIGSGAAISDLYACGSSDFYAISNGTIYYSSDYNTWSACTGSVSFTPTQGDWAVLGTKVVYCDRVSGKPLVITPGTPPTISELGGAGTAFPSVSAERCCVSQNTLLVAHGGNNVYFSAVNDPSTFGATDYFPVRGEKEPIVALAEVGGSLVCVKTKGIYLRSANDGDFDGGDFNPILTGVTIRNSAYKNYCTGNNQLFVLTSAGPYRVSSDGSIVNLLELAPGFRDKWTSLVISNGNARLEYWQARDWFIMMDNFNAYIFDNKLNIWLYFSNFGGVGVNHPSDKYFITNNNMGSDKCRRWHNYSIGVGEESSVSQEISTLWQDCGNECSDKQVREIHLYAYGVSGIELHGRNNPRQAMGVSTQIGNTISCNNNVYVYKIKSNKEYKEFALKLSGSIGMVVKGIAVVYDERRTSKQK